MHRCYFVRHQDETGYIKIFLLSLSEERSKQACAKRSCGKPLITLSILNEVKISGLPHMIENASNKYSVDTFAWSWSVLRLHKHTYTE